MSLTPYNNALVPRQAQAALQTLASSQMMNGRNITAIYNEGTIIVPANRQNGGDVAIYNAPGGTVVLQDTHSCSGCDQEFHSLADKNEHKRQYPSACRMHKVCFFSWKEHNAESYHTFCPVRNCAKAGVNFGSDSRYMQHFRNKHDYS